MCDLLCKFFWPLLMEASGNEFLVQVSVFQQLASQLLPEDGKEEASRRGGRVQWGLPFFCGKYTPKV